MPRGRRTGFGRGFWSGFGPGRGNPYPFCRNFPWLPRGWWTGMYGPIAPVTGIYPMPHSHPYAYGRWIR